MTQRLQYPVVAFYPGVIQEARPDGDVSGNWAPSSGADSFAVIDEVTFDDSDFIQSPESPANNAEEVTFSNVTDPEVHDNHVVHYRYQKGGDAQIDLIVTLLDGATTIASWTHTNISTAVRMAHQALTLAEAENITDYTDLRLRFSANQP